MVMAPKPGLAGCWGLARTSPWRAFKRNNDGGVRRLGQGVRLIALGAKEEEQHAKKEEQLLEAWAAFAVVGVGHCVGYLGDRVHRWTRECVQSLGRVVGNVRWLRHAVSTLREALVPGCVGLFTDVNWGDERSRDGWVAGSLVQDGTLASPPAWCGITCAATSLSTAAAEWVAPLQTGKRR